MPSGGRTEPGKHRAIWNTRRSEVQKLIQRLLKAALKPAAIRQSVAGATHGWGMTMQDQLDFRALEAWSAQRITQHDAMVVLSDMIDKSVTSIDEFESIHSSLNKQSKLGREPAHRWRFVLPFSFRCATDVDSPIRLTVLGSTFTVQSWLSATRTMGKSRVDKALLSLKFQQERTTPEWCITVTASGSDLDSAWKPVDAAFDALRGILELAFGYMLQSFHWPERSLREIPHPPWMLGWNRDTKTLEQREFITEEPGIRSVSGVVLNAGFFSALRSNLSLFAGVPDDNMDVRSIIADGLRLYVQALDANRHHRIYLGLWQCAEAITLAGEDRGSGGRVCCRLAEYAKPWNCDTSGLLDVLNGLYKERCKIVHRGIHDGIDLDDVNLLKNCCESGLVWLMEHAKRLRTKAQLNRFHEFANLNDSEFDAVEKSVKLTKAFRTSVRRKRASKRP